MHFRPERGLHAAKHLSFEYVHARYDDHNNNNNPENYETRARLTVFEKFKYSCIGFVSGAVTFISPS